MLDQLQAPAILQPAPADEMYTAVRLRQMQAKVENPYSMPFLLWMYERLLDEVLAGLTGEQKRQVDTLLMLSACVYKAEYRDLRGFDLDALTETLAQSTLMMSWDHL